MPENEDVKKLSEATFDISEYLMDIAKTEGLAPGLHAVEGGVTIHLACHARAQNMGPKAADLLREIPDTEIKVIERCSGHGGSWGVMKENFDVALKIGRPAARQVQEAGHGYVVSECPLARDHMVQGLEKLTEGDPMPKLAAVKHPVQVLAHAYGLGDDENSAG